MTTKAIISKNANDIEVDILRLIAKGSISEEMLFSADICYYMYGLYSHDSELPESGEIVLFEDVMIAINRVKDFIIKECKHW